MANVQTIAATDGDVFAVHISRAASEMIARSIDCRAGTQGMRLLQTNNTVCIRLSPARAEQLQEWALDAYTNADRGQKRTLTSLTKSLTAALREYGVRDCVPDPGIDAIVSARNGGARLSFGTVAVDINNDLVQIVEGPNFYRVSNEKGRHAENDGRRFDWRYGYNVVLCEEGGVLSKKKFFCPPHALWSKDDGGITHLKLVYDADACDLA